MELETVSSCCSSSSPSPQSSAADSSAEDAADRTELEAAEALADLAQLAIMREKVVESAAKWGSKGKRVRKRVKNESSPCESRLKPPDLEAPLPDLAEERAALEEQQAQTISRNLIIEPVKAEVDDEMPKPFLASALRCRSTGSGRSRQTLSEAEKEERRIRRILANRESARQTIRRRQALCEELTRKAADLTYENENLKTEKDLALKEYQSLETINKQLREQVLRSIEPKPRECQEAAPKSSQVEISASPSFYLYNQHPFPLFCWPSVIQSSHLVQSRLEPPNGFTVPSTTSAVAPAKVMLSQEQEKPANDNGPKPPFYVVPCPWAVSQPDQSNGVQSHVSFRLKNTQEGICTNGHHSDSSSPRLVVDRKSQPSHLPSRIKEEDSGSTETRPVYDLNESAVEFPSEGGGGQPIGFQPEEHGFSGGPTFVLRREDALQSTNGVTPMPPGHFLISLPEKKQEIVEYPSKKLVDATAAAEARKRRKELTRLKNLHGRQCRMQV